MNEGRDVAPNTDSLKGMLLMLGAAFCIGGMHVLIRHISEDIHPFEIAFFRNLFALFAVAPWFIKLGWAPLYTKRLGLMFWRAVINAACMLAFFYGD